MHVTSSESSSNPFSQLQVKRAGGKLLVQIWEQANVSNEHLLGQLKEWCAEAEASGIRSLEEFAIRLRGYAMQPV